MKHIKLQGLSRNKKNSSVIKGHTIKALTIGFLKVINKYMYMTLRYLQ